MTNMNYYIQGDAANADKIKAAFEAKGISDGGNSFIHGNYLYFSEGGEVDFCSIGGHIANLIKTHPDYKELELPKPHYDIKNFYAGMPVLARDANDKEWRYVLYSHYTERYGLMRFNAGATIWNQCIPFDGNQHLLGTTDMPNEEFINW